MNNYSLSFFNSGKLSVSMQRVMVNLLRVRAQCSNLTIAAPNVLFRKHSLFEIMRSEITSPPRRDAMALWPALVEECCHKSLAITRITKSSMTK